MSINSQAEARKPLLSVETFRSPALVLGGSPPACELVGPPERLTRPTEVVRGVSANIAVANGVQSVGAATGAPVVRSQDVSRPLGGFLKRALDLLIAVVALTLLSPLLVLVGLLIYLTAGRPVFYAQPRVGFGGTPFRCFKLRTMVNDADRALASYLESNPGAAREWRTSQKLRHDPRVTAVGHLLRRSSIDELPQLWNVILGQMSCVGPRPVVSSELDRYGLTRRDYIKARPGLTGLWQVSGRNRLDYSDRVALDRYYVRRWSIWLDLMILIRTIPAVLRFSDTT